MAKGVSAPRIATVIPLTAQAIRKVGHRYRQGGLERALYEKERPGAAALLEDSQRQRIIAMACSDPPEGRARWTVRLLVEEAVKRRLVPRVGRETVRVLLLTTTSSRGGKKMWCVAVLNEDYIARMEDVLANMNGLITRNEPVVCVDEKPISLHADVRPGSAAAPGREARRDNEYKRNGTANVFCAVEPKTGRHFNLPDSGSLRIRVRTGSFPSGHSVSGSRDHPPGDG